MVKIKKDICLKLPNLYLRVVIIYRLDKLLKLSHKNFKFFLKITSFLKEYLKWSCYKVNVHI